MRACARALAAAPRATASDGPATASHSSAARARVNAAMVTGIFDDLSAERADLVMVSASSASLVSSSLAASSSKEIQMAEETLGLVWRQFGRATASMEKASAPEVLATKPTVSNDDDDGDSLVRVVVFMLLGSRTPNVSVDVMRLDGKTTAQPAGARARMDKTTAAASDDVVWPQA